MPCTSSGCDVQVRSGLEVLVEREPGSLAGRRVGLLAHGASVTRALRYAWHVLAGLDRVRVQALFSPEHGLMGTHQDLVGVSRQCAGPLEGVPLYSLYGEDPSSLRPSEAMLSDLDVLLVDLQDVGSRYYTYVATLSHCMEACGQAGVEVWVLDRPNPLGGELVEGPAVSPGFRSFVGHHPLPVRHGLTIGECARMIREVYGVRCTLRVVAMEGWRRDMWFDQTGLPWVLPSPNMPTLDTAIVYPGTCLLEGTNLSEGRGTTRPFEILGAPWVEPARLADRLEAQGLPGVRFRPLWFLPTFQKHTGSACGGIQIHVLDRTRFRPFRTGVEILRAVAQLWPSQTAWRTEPYEFEHERLAIDLLAGGPWLRHMIEKGEDPEAHRAGWKRETEAFEANRERCLIYR